MARVFQSSTVCIPKRLLTSRNRSIENHATFAHEMEGLQNRLDAGRITTAGYGPDNPIESNDTDEGRAKNRRLELAVVNK